MSFFLLWQNKNLELESDLHERHERFLIRGAYHLHGKNRNSSGKTKWFVPFLFESFVIRGDETFLLFSVCSADLDILCGGLFSHQVKFYSFMFMQKISTQVVRVNAKSSRFLRVN